jgi:hypothetical protein
MIPFLTSQFMAFLYVCIRYFGVKHNGGRHKTLFFVVNASGQTNNIAIESIHHNKRIAMPREINGITGELIGAPPPTSSPPTPADPSRGGSSTSS